MKTVNKIKPVRNIAYIKGVKVIEAKGEDMLELQLQVPISETLLGRLKLTIPVIRDEIEKLYKSASIEGNRTFAGFDAEELIGKVCLIEIRYWNNDGKRKVEFLPFGRYKEMKIENLEFVPEDVLPKVCTE